MPRSEDRQVRGGGPRMQDSHTPVPADETTDPDQLRLVGTATLGLAEPTRLGRPPRLSDSDWRRVERALLAGAQAHGFDTDLWTLPRVAEVIWRTCGVSYHPGHVLVAVAPPPVEPATPRPPRQRA